jgi:undecaprenyl-diphosphatase
MDITFAAFLGLIQGLTEWFPVSSSGHLVLARKLSGVQIPENEWLFFNVVVHIASILVVAIIFRKEIYRITVSFFGIFPELKKGKKLKTVLKKDPYKLFAVLIVVATVPTALIGWVFQKWFESMFERPEMVGVALIFTGCILMLTYRVAAKRKIGDMNAADALAIGTMQGIAIMPGISRSGATISTGMVLGIRRDEAARFSFILAIPAIIGALVMNIGDVRHFQPDFALPVAVGFIVSFIVGIIAIKSLLYIIKKESFFSFAFYCWALGAAVLIWYFLL